jgi:hypothetical protein
MVLTRSDARTAYTHVLDHVLGQGDGTPLKTALAHEGVDHIFQLVNLDNVTIHNLEYADSANKNAVTTVKMAEKMLLKCFINFVAVPHNDGNPIGDDWTLITQLEFDLFRIVPQYFASQPPRPTTTVTPPPSTNNSNTSPYYNPVEQFPRGIKRDATLFPTLKDDKYHDIWHWSFKTQATAQAVSEVLDATYIPTTPDDIALFQEKHKYVYAVLESKVLTNRGKALIRDHGHDFDAQ